MPLAQHNNLVQPFYNLYRVQEKVGGGGGGGGGGIVKKSGGAFAPPAPPPSYTYAIALGIDTGEFYSPSPRKSVSVAVAKLVLRCIAWLVNRTAGADIKELDYFVQKINKH